MSRTRNKVAPVVSVNRSTYVPRMGSRRADRAIKHFVDPDQKSTYNKCKCGGYKGVRSDMCAACRYEEDLKNKPIPSRQQMRALLAFAQAGSVKGAAGLMGISVKTVEWHLAKLRKKANLDSLIDLIVWGFRKGILATLVCFATLSTDAKPPKPPKTVVPPYSTNLTLAWSPSTSTNVTQYRLWWTNMTKMTWTNAVTTQTNLIVRNLWTTNRYNFNVQAGTASGLWSTFPPFITWSIGSVIVSSPTALKINNTP